MKIVYLSGTWDLFHYGHLKMIKRAWKLGALVIGVNTKAYCKSIGKKPYFSFSNRKTIIEALRYTDKVCSHTNGTYLPDWVDIRVVGSDWGKTKEQKEALLIMKKKGIKVIVYPRTKGVSTTKIEKELR